VHDAFFEFINVICMASLLIVDDEIQDRVENVILSAARAY
jgi:hypothetical protein